MVLWSYLRKAHGYLTRHQWRLVPLPFPVLLVVLMALTVILTTLLVYIPSTIQPQHKMSTPEMLESVKLRRNDSTFFQFHVQAKTRERETENTTKHQLSHQGPASETNTNSRVNEDDISLKSGGSPYHNWELFAADYLEMFHSLKIFVYPDAYMMNKSSSTSPFDHIFLPYENPFNPKLGNYFSEHAFKIALLRSSLVTPNPGEAHFFFMPFSINAMRNDPRLHSVSSIYDFVVQYINRISSQFKFWNASGGADHFFAYCHSIGRDAASKHPELHNNAIQVTCSSNYYQRVYIAHKDVSLPQIWPRQHEQVLNPPDARNKLVFFSGRAQNSHIRKELMDLWGNDNSMDIFSGNLSFPYEEGFRRSKYCLHVAGYEVNTARVSDAIHYGCIPVLISDYYDLPFANILDWSKFSIIISPSEVAFLKSKLLSVSKETYLNMYQNLGIVRRHFQWHTTPESYDAFYMTAFQLWLRRGLHRL